MATAESEYADRLDLIAYRTYGAVTDSAMSALFRANPSLPLAMREGHSIQVPEAPQPLNYGASFGGWDYSGLNNIIEANENILLGDFDDRDFDPRDFLTEL